MTVRPDRTDTVSEAESSGTLAMQVLSILIVDDNAFMRRILRTILSGLGCLDIIEAGDGQAAWRAFVSRSPDIVITDWEMDGIDGIGLTRILRDRARSPNPYVPIVMLSAHSEKQRVIVARDAGVTEYLVKPVSARAIHQRIESVVFEPRPFVETRTFFGPDRRRFQAFNHTGPDQRKSLIDLSASPPLPESLLLT